MCYDIDTIVYRAVKQARRKGATPNEIDEQVALLLETWYGADYYHVSGFDHPILACIVMQDHKLTWVEMSWGLVPGWVRTAAEAVKIRNRTLNARCETIFEKAAFRKAAPTQRCLVPVSGFFEHHHRHGRSFPYRIHHTDDRPLLLAGIWDVWNNPAAGATQKTFAIVTTAANALMMPIHNHHPEGPRMPLVMPAHAQRQWLDAGTPRPVLEKIMVPYAGDDLHAYTVKTLRGKKASPNTEEAIAPHHYPELNEQQSLF